MIRPSNRMPLAALALALLAAGCATNPVSGRADFVLLSEQQEIALGMRADQDVKKQYALYDRRGLQTYVDSIGQRLARVSHRSGLAFRFTVLDSPEVNAFALPGGHIYVARGIIAFLNSEAELAAVLAHEIGHVTARHSVRQISAAQGTDILFNVLGAVSPAMRSAGVQNVTGLLGNALLAGYGREHELEADRLGAEYLARAGYDPQAMMRVIGVLKNQETFDAEIARQEGRSPRAYHGVFATHPDNDARLREAVGAADRLRSAHADDGRDAFLDRCEGLVFGDSAREGIVREGAFVHPDLGIGFRIPPGWRVENSRQRLVLVAPGGDARLEMSMDKRPKEAPADLLRRSTRGAADDIEIDPVPGLESAMAQPRGRFVAAVYFGAGAYLFSGSARSDQAMVRSIAGMRASVRSFHALSDDERSIPVLALKLMRADAQTRYATLARSSPLAAHGESVLRLINASYPAGEPKPGARIKVIE